jgi:hypothetical protein
LIKQECGYFLLICSRNYSKSMFISLWKEHSRAIIKLTKEYLLF